MRLLLSPDQEFFTETTQRYLADRCPPATVRRWTSSRLGYEDDWWTRGAELGWTAPLVPEELGGGSVSGSGLVDLTLVAEAFGRHAAPGPLGPVNVVLDAIARDGSPAQRDRWVGTLLDGSATAAWCAPPIDGGSTVTVSGGVLDGVASPVLGADGAGVLLVPAATDGGLVQFLVPADADGVETERLETIDLLQRAARVTFRSVPVDPTMQLGAEPADRAVRRSEQLALVLQLAETVGAMGRLFDITLQWVFDRHSFGRPLASYQAIKHRFADMRTWLEASRATAAAAAVAAQEERDDADELVSIAKAFVAEHGPELAHECIQFHGGIGVTTEHDLHLYARRVIQNSAIYGGHREHRQRVARLLEEKKL